MPVKLRISTIAPALALLLASAPAAAVPIASDLLTISADSVNGYFEAELTGDMIGCNGTGTFGQFSCTGSNADMLGGAITLDSWNMTLDQDPYVNAIVALTNNTLVTQTYVISVLLPVFPVLPSSLIGGSIQGGITSDATAGTLASNAVSANAIYTASIDGTTAATLLPHSSSVSSGPFLSASFLSPPNTLSFGTPIPSQPGPAVASTIGLTLEFTLTPGDSASFTSVFVVEPVPEPGTFGLVSIGIVGIAALRRRTG